jgi:queuine tRNA-ribosyltransferase
MAPLQLNNGVLDLPVFLPDATNGVVRGVDADDLQRAGVTGLVMNVFHLMQNPGSTTVNALGGLHGMSGWQGPIITDSGGFQIYSLIRQRPGNGNVTEKGMTVKTEGARRKYHLTPEKSIQLQLAYGADVVMCLDECTHVDAITEDQVLAVDRTVRWARRCKTAFESVIAQRKSTVAASPRIFGVIQGGDNLELRKICAEALIEIGFDGFGYGGWPLDQDGNLLRDVLAATRSFVPQEYPMHALGIGHPESIAECARMGYGIFDSALPTRDARHGRLYLYTQDPDHLDPAHSGTWFERIYIQDHQHIKSNRPVSPFCDCYTCSRYSAGYLHHLFTSKESLYNRLATVHNLRFMSVLMTRLRLSGSTTVNP